MDVVHALERLARQARREVIVDIVDRAVEKIEELGGQPQVPSDLASPSRLTSVVGWD